jgi:hypothetical protein
MTQSRRGTRRYQSLSKEIRLGFVQEPAVDARHTVLAGGAFGSCEQFAGSIPIVWSVTAWERLKLRTTFILLGD